jgi:hypothetical protein
MTQSRRELLSLAVAAVAGEAAFAADASAAEPLDLPNRQYVSRYELVLTVAPALRSAFRARMATTSGRTFDVELQDPESVDPLVRMVELALAGKAKLALEVENDNKTVRSVRFEAP